MRTNYKIALVFALVVFALVGAMVLHGPVVDHTEVHVGVSDD